MVAVIWVATGFHLLTFKRQLYEAYRQNSANLVRAFEQDVVHALHGAVARLSHRVATLSTTYIAI